MSCGPPSNPALPRVCVTITLSRTLPLATHMQTRCCAWRGATMHSTCDPHPHPNLAPIEPHRRCCAAWRSTWALSHACGLPAPFPVLTNESKMKAGPEPVPYVATRRAPTRRLPPACRVSIWPIVSTGGLIVGFLYDTGALDTPLLIQHLHAPNTAPHHLPCAHACCSRMAVAQFGVRRRRGACVRVQHLAPNAIAPEGRSQPEIGGGLQCAVLCGIC